MAALLQLLQQNFTTISPSSFLFASIIFILALNFLPFRKTKPNLPPAPPKLPIIGNLHQLSSTPHMSLHSLAKKFGPIMYLQLGQIPTVIVSSSRLAKELYKTYDLVVSNRPQLYSAKYLFYNCSDMGFSPYGPYWRYIRKICTLQLLSTKQVQAYNFVREEAVARLINRIRESSPAVTDLTKLLARYANDVVCRVALGRHFSQGGDQYDQYGFQKLLEEHQELLGGFTVGDFFPSLKLLHSFTGAKSRLVNTSRRLDQFLDEVIKEHRNPARRKDEDKNDLVDLLLELHNDASSEFPLTMDNVKALILDMFAAGTDTTAIVLDWGMTELIMNPQVMKKAQAEIRSVVGGRRVVLETDLPQLHYLKAVIKENYRLHPPAPVLMPRESTEDITLGGYKIPAGTRFYVNAWSMGRDPEVWENPEKFEPERFLGSKIDFRGQDFELIPFAAGRRNCPGLTFAIPTVELPLAQLLHSFDWDLPPGVEAKDLDMTEVFGITMHRISHLMIVAKPHFA